MNKGQPTCSMITLLMITLLLAPGGTPAEPANSDEAIQADAPPRANQPLKERPAITQRARVQGTGERVTFHHKDFTVEVANGTNIVSGKFRPAAPDLVILTLPKSGTNSGSRTLWYFIRPETDPDGTRVLLRPEDKKFTLQD